MPLCRPRPFVHALEGRGKRGGTDSCMRLHPLRHTLDLDHLCLPSGRRSLPITKLSVCPTRILQHNLYTPLRHDTLTSPINYNITALHPLNLLHHGQCSNLDPISNNSAAITARIHQAMGKLIKNHWARLIILTAAGCTSSLLPRSPLNIH